MTDKKYTNHLAGETSPYLLQHVHNPVDWHPWGEVALALALQQDKPILVSIGYSACHWCHVMEHESFENEATAAIMNKHFVCIKVDREERPDLDKIYQTVHQMLMKRPGGWPLNMFLTADDHIPFFGGTYFPNVARYGMPAFSDLLGNLSKFYRDNRDEIREQNSRMAQYFRQLEQGHAGGDISSEPLVAARRQIESQFDPVYGGFGQAPKFPHPTTLERCLRHWHRSKLNSGEDEYALKMVTTTLQAMANGGLYDQLRGGFYRYSVDEKWTIPHFEKMLYDNAQLLPLYVDASIATDDANFTRIANETAAWVIDEMQSPEGAYYATLDADSEGQEGIFYTWSDKELASLLSTLELTVVNKIYGLKGEPNFEGRWHLNVALSQISASEQLNIPPEDFTELLISAKQKLLDHQNLRIRPGRDEKILTAWNGLTIYAMARAGRVLTRVEYLNSASRAVDFVRDKLWRNGRLLATTKDDQARLNAYLDDYVFVIYGILELLESRWSTNNLNFAIEMMYVVLDHFEDKEQGGFFFTSDDHESLVYRPKTGSDDSVPSGNGIAAQVLLRLGHLINEPRFLDAAARTLTAFGDELNQNASSCGALLTALEDFLYPGEFVLLRGNETAMQEWSAVCHAEYRPGRHCYKLPVNDSALPASLGDRKVLGDITAYICSGTTCQPPVTDKKNFISSLRRVEPENQISAS
jgi:uncharacterized protein YyaL (SSP411 family)